MSCNRCGKCCLLPDGKRCPHLEGEIGKITTCKVWNNPLRVGSVIAVYRTCFGLVVYKCQLRKDQKKIIEGCTND